MAQSAYCPTCERTVYLEDEDTAVCPVCSTPLLTEVQPPSEAAGSDAARSDAAEGMVPER